MEGGNYCSQILLTKPWSGFNTSLVKIQQLSRTHSLPLFPAQKQNDHLKEKLVYDMKGHFLG